ncbi:phytanoyl-CoA dioxygenase family protein [Modestobacter muralis]|uniref:Phytanoyl-CoA dioxygenase family protein n=1 Tax=Modestobacter muralis TaxID=1608614 RepID=A0A6P0ETZ4_9ACTN|nr:phytanoyl-CoA dioxygenase family protein [Modestobacter muralis]NEK94380.1 phytanoyl-CoA dioxygenase family protein [Modestobacter muralis]NEN51268.1 phytanoyl-CoA dioxygenase family protein [Modestobacter muralis]
MTTSTQAPTDIDVQAMRDRIYTDGIVGVPGAFSPDWADQLNRDIQVAFEEARSRENGAIGRGPNRWYVEVHPEQISGFLELVTHPAVTGVCEAVLGPDYEIVEVGFDIPFEGAMNQPWHRDFPSPELTYRDKQINSLAINATAVDTAEDMGPFEVAPGTQFDHDPSFKHDMFPPKDLWSRYEERAVRKYPKRGDISIRSALTIHRGTANQSAKSRPVLVLGVDAPGAGHGAMHDLAVTKGFWETLPESVRAHLKCPVVDELTPITQKHDIEGLVMGEA